MSIHRHHCGERSSRQGQVLILPFFWGKWLQRVFFLSLTGLLVGLGIFADPRLRGASQPGDISGSSPSQAGVSDSDLVAADEVAEKSRRIASTIANRVLDYLTWGPPLEAKLRLRAWAAGREVVEVGYYQQAGRGTGRSQMGLQVPIAEGTARWQQVCDGRLAWTREELAGEVRVRRVDLGRLDELLSVQSAVDLENREGSESEGSRITPRLRVGGLAEIVDRIQADYRLSVSEGHIEEVDSEGRIEKVRMLVIKGEMRTVILEAMQAAGGGVISPLVPRQVMIAIPADSLAEPLPARIEFWSEAKGRLISLLEIYDSTTIEPPPIEHFRFEAGGDDFVNETELYLRRFSGGLANRATEEELR